MGASGAGIRPAEYARRRRQLMRMAGDDAIVVVPAAPERVRSHDTLYPYRQDSDFLYLCGFGEPDAVLVLVPGRAHGEVLLFCRERDPEREAWDGPRLGPDAAVARLGVDDAFPFEDLDEILPGLLEGRARVYYHLGRDTEFDLKLIGWVNRIRTHGRRRDGGSHEFLELGHLLHEFRLFKSRDEVRLLRRAAEISAEAHLAAMRAARTAQREYEIEAALQYVFRRRGAVAAYPPIVGAGANACVMHHVANDGPVRPGDLVLVDAGAEVAGYAADITRTFPASGRFTRPQAALYALVLAAQRAALAEVRPGRPWNAVHEAAVRTVTEGLLRLGLLQGGLEENLGSAAYRRFYPHKTGHWLGLDVHDVGDYRIDGEFRELEPGMVFTVEPGLYVAPDDRSVAPRWRGIGIRIEDDVLVIGDGCEVLTDAVPREIEAIEAAMAG
ncbi:aminopeptidase P N-terminal domain-containing protein [Coralloluteibacterium thermophilus]|uniref:Xaa-Pro aminopeptidase n=1 Tax=Coralloluteibacterium thermophilum TaxID=2707049 RepID=A0ABV9NJJ2_9GAMM